MEARAARLGYMLEDGARDCLDPRWLFIEVDLHNDAVIQKDIQRSTCPRCLGDGPHSPVQGQRSIGGGSLSAPQLLPHRTDNDAVFVKLVFLPRNPLGHELEMQQVLASIENTPTPLGTIKFENSGWWPWDAEEDRPRTFISPRGDPEETLCLYGFAFRH